MRPTRIGRETPLRSGLVSVGIGIDPDVETEDPEPPTDRATASGIAYVPFVTPGGASIAQSKSGEGTGFAIAVTVTLDAPPTLGNLLVLMVGVDTDDATFVLTNGTWTLVDEAFSGTDTNWPQRMYVQEVTGATGQATQVSTTSPGILKVGIVELTGVDTVDDTATASNTSSTTVSLTPTAGLPAVLLSSVLGRNGTGNALTPASGMTEWVEIAATDHPFGLNYRIESSTTGSYTVGSSGASANSSVIGAAFVDTGDSVVWAAAPNTIDDSDTTYDRVFEDGIDATGGPLWRITLDDSYLIASFAAVIGFENAGSVTVKLQGATEADYSDAVDISSVTITATGSFIADDLADSWEATAVYRYWQLVLTTTAQDVYVYEVSLLDHEPGGGVTDHGDLTGRDAADQHPADAIEVDPTVVGEADAQAALEAIESLIAGGQTHGALGSAETFDAATGGHTGTLDDDCTFTLAASVPGPTLSMAILLTQDGTGGHAITLPGSVVNAADIEAAQITTAGTSQILVLLSFDAATTWFAGWWGGAGGSSLTVKDEGTPLATDATTLDFVGAGVTASGTGAEKTITISGAPTGSAGGDLSGTYPNPSVVDDSHSHTGTTAPGHGAHLLESGHSVPFTFDELLQESDGSDFLYASS